jgi:hypothetical protein
VIGNKDESQGKKTCCPEIELGGERTASGSSGTSHHGELPPISWDGPSEQPSFAGLSAPNSVSSDIESGTDDLDFQCEVGDQSGLLVSKRTQNVILFFLFSVMTRPRTGHSPLINAGAVTVGSGLR